MKKLAIATLLTASLAFTGCGVFKVQDTAGSPYVTPSYVTTKASAITLIIAGEVMKHNPDARQQLEVAQKSIREVLGKDQVTGADVANIIAQIPKVQNSKNYFYIQAGVLILQDDLNRVAVANPELFRAALLGADQSLTEVLSQ